MLWEQLTDPLFVMGLARLIFWLVLAAILVVGAGAINDRLANRPSRHQRQIDGLYDSFHRLLAAVRHAQTRTRE